MVENNKNKLQAHIEQKRMELMRLRNSSKKKNEDNI